MPTPAAAPTTAPSLSRQDRREANARLLGEAARAPDARSRHELRDETVRNNVEVAASVAHRFRNRGIPEDDLAQVACLGLVKAVERFDPDQGHDFLSFAVPTMRGEVRRHFRDQGWMVRPPRHLQELQALIARAENELSQRLGRPPTSAQLAEHLDEAEADVVEARTSNGCFAPTSLDSPVAGDDGDGQMALGDLVAGDDRRLEAAEARVVLDPVVRALPPRDRRILQLRFVDGLTQREIGDRLGVTQMQVSRLLARILRDLRVALGDPA